MCHCQIKTKRAFEKSATLSILAFMTRKKYPTDLSDAEWEIIAPLIPPAKPGGRPRKVDLRKVINAINYLFRK